MKRHTLLISKDNSRRLEWLVDRALADGSLDRRCVANLQTELQRARLVSAEEVPDDLVTMNSIVRLRDLDTEEVEIYELVYPTEADIEMNRVSVLAPIGTALLGYRAGDVIEWPVPAGIRRIQVEQVLYQPETAGVVTDAA